MIKPQHFQYELRDGVGLITLDRPDRLNALTFEVYRELKEVFLQLDREADVRSIVITGAGRAFCSGGDVEDIIGALFARGFQDLLEFTRATGDLILAMLECRKPIVGALNGTVAGAGAVIATACDFRVAGPKAKIAFLFTKVGLSGADMGASWLLPRIVGMGRATEILMLGDFVPAEEAQRIGLYHRVVEQEQVLDQALKLAARLAKGPAFGLEITKKLLLREAHMDVRSAMANEVEIQAACMLHPDFRSAYEAFKAKKEPAFQ
ncbi:MAG: enoyl-CoA hydratase family protein [Candidatus Eremiobacteraeota bacterium]|nr:enoyl-CoA hydratase family protein [Candidatus Eremiobacteraeota bacterium]MCW5865972.1 enoyl-CoA hydratase family protein [Candidatus Eremiobacteraeota bacterium]